MKAQNDDNEIGEYKHFNGNLFDKMVFNDVLKEFMYQKDRLKHIFKYQVYGLAPTKIIYRIALNFILGFDKNKEITEYNFKCVDTVPLVKEGKLEEELEKIFGEKLDG